MSSSSQTVKNKDIEYAILGDPTLVCLAHDARTSLHLGKDLEYIQSDMEDFVHRIERKLDTYMAKEDRAMLLQGFDEIVSESVNEIGHEYRKVAEAVAEREICGMFSPKLKEAMDEFVHLKTEHLFFEVDKLMTKFRMDYTESLLDLVEGIKTFAPPTMKETPRYSTFIAEAYLTFRKEGMQRMHALCDELQGITGDVLAHGKEVDRKYFEVERSKLEHEEYSKLEMYLDYYQKKVNGEFLGDFEGRMTDRSVFRKLDALAKETTMFNVLITYSMFKSIKPDLDPEAVSRAGVPVGEFTALLEQYQTV